MSLNGPPQEPRQPARKAEGNVVDLEAQRSRLGRNTARLNDLMLSLAKKTGQPGVVGAVEEGRMKPKELLKNIGTENRIFRNGLALTIGAVSAVTAMGWPELADVLNFSKDTLVQFGDLPVNMHNAGLLGGVASTYLLPPIAFSMARLNSVFKEKGYRKQLQEAGASI